MLSEIENLGGRMQFYIMTNLHKLTHKSTFDIDINKVHLHLIFGEPALESLVPNQKVGLGNIHSTNMLFSSKLHLQIICYEKLHKIW